MCSFFTGFIYTRNIHSFACKREYNGTESDDKYDPVEIVKWKIDREDGRKTLNSYIMSLSWA